MHLSYLHSASPILLVKLILVFLLVDFMTYKMTLFKASAMSFAGCPMNEAGTPIIHKPSVK